MKKIFPIILIGIMLVSVVFVSGCIGQPSGIQVNNTQTNTTTINQTRPALDVNPILDACGQECNAFGYPIGMCVYPQYCGAPQVEHPTDAYCPSVAPSSTCCCRD